MLKMHVKMTEQTAEGENAGHNNQDVILQDKSTYDR